MKKLIAVTSIISGLLLVVVPRYVLPTCEFQGFPAMHCSDTAKAEMVTGLVFIVVGTVMLFLKPGWISIAGGGVALILSVISFVVPDNFGYCRSAQMPCNYGTVPGVRSVAVVGGLIIAAGVTRMLRDKSKKRP